jgi:hypothetical protein
MRKILPSLVLTFLAVSSAHASTFTLDSYNVSYNTSDPGLVLSEADLLADGSSFDLVNVGDSFSTALFRIGTADSTLNFDDLLPQTIDVSFLFSSPPPDFGGTSSGISGSFWWGQSYGYVLWDNPLLLSFGSTGLLSITLSNALFTMPGAATVYATFQLVRAETLTTPEPATILSMLVAISLCVGLAFWKGIPLLSSTR